MKLLSDAGEYAIRAVVWIARHPHEPQKVKQIAGGTQTPAGYLIKVLQSLARAGILSARRGSLGGFTLRREPGSLSVFDIVQAVDAFERIETCPLGLVSHGKRLCPMHRQIDDAMAMIQSQFQSCTIKQLLTHATGSQPLLERLVTVKRKPKR